MNKGTIVFYYDPYEDQIEQYEYFGQQLGSSDHYNPLLRPSNPYYQESRQHIVTKEGKRVYRSFRLDELHTTKEQALQEREKQANLLKIELKREFSRHGLVQVLFDGWRFSDEEDVGILKVKVAKELIEDMMNVNLSLSEYEYV